VKPRVFLLSPASTSGERARILLRPQATFPLARAVQSRAGAPLGDVFAFLSGLYFRGKLTYARAFAPSRTLIITSTEGLWHPEHHVRAGQLEGFAAVDIQRAGETFRRPLARDARRVAAAWPEHDVVLLGSIASAKYVDVLGEVFGERLLFPGDFVGRGDMSRGGLLLRAARAGDELAYAPVLSAVRHGKRPARLAPVRGILRDAQRDARGEPPQSDRAYQASQPK
jgi:hypothetical protein